MLTMTEQVREVLDKSFEEVQASSLILGLLTVYSKLYLNGGYPGTCGACHRDYYNQLKNNGMELAKQYEEAKNRTCKPAWNGLIYIRDTARHWNSELLTDKEAMMLLEKGFLKSADFSILPAAFDKPVPEEKIQASFEQRHTPRIKKAKKA